MMRTHGRAGSGKKGAMPMALIAVALLVAGAFYGIIYAGIERGTENADSANAEFGTIDDAIERATVTIESELGRIITDVSSDDCGTLVDRSKRFSELSDVMFEERFPNTCKGVVTELEDRSIRLSLENMNLGGDVIGGDSCASFLSAKGTVTLVFTSESTVSRKTIQVDADATSALPLIAETSTRFELAVGGSGSVLSQMIDYQLNAVASQRIMSSYGMFARGGDFGTSGIITEKDVYQALKNALGVLERMYFRNTSDGRLANCAFVDLADLIVLDRDAWSWMSERCSPRPSSRGSMSTPSSGWSTSASTGSSSGSMWSWTPSGTSSTSPASCSTRTPPRGTPSITSGIRCPTSDTTRTTTGTSSSLG